MSTERKTTEEQLITARFSLHRPAKKEARVSLVLHRGQLRLDLPPIEPATVIKESY